MNSVKQKNRIAFLMIFPLVCALCLQLRAGAAVIKTQSAADNVVGGIRGIDVSHYQGDIDWEKVAGEDVNFAIVRASCGVVVDESFKKNIQGALDQGLHVGAYHYAKFNDRKSMKEEAAFFLDQLGGLKLTYPIFLDIESNTFNKAVSRQDLTDLCIEFMETLRENGWTAMIYSGSNFIRDRISASRLADYDFWVANYMEEPLVNQKIWQHTSYGAVSGIKGRVCIDIAYADLALQEKLTVSRTISDSIKTTLNERHGADLPMETLDMVRVKSAVVTALQSELVRQLGADLAVTGAMDAETLGYLEKVPFTYGETKGNMTYLVQVMLFYKGHYTEELTGAYDTHTMEALKRYQQSIDRATSGAMDRETIWYLFS